MTTFSWWAAVPALLGAVVGGGFNLFGQAWFSRKGRQANLEERNAAHLEKAVSDLMAVCAEIPGNNVSEGTTLGGLLAQTRRVAALLEVAGGWATRCKLLGFDALLLQMRLQVSGFADVTPGRRQTQRALEEWDALCTGILAAGGSWLRDPMQYDDPRMVPLDRVNFAADQLRKHLAEFFLRSQ